MSLTVRHAPRRPAAPPAPSPAFEPHGEPPPLPWILRYFHLLCFLLMIVGVVAQVPAGLFSAQAPVDPIAHFVSPMALGSIFYTAVMWERAELVPVPQTAFLVTALGIGTAAAWEILEFYGDQWHLLDGWQVDNGDTMWDLQLGTLGALVGAAFHVAIHQAR